MMTPTQKTSTSLTEAELTDLEFELEHLQSHLYEFFKSRRQGTSRPWNTNDIFQVINQIIDTYDDR